MKQLSACLRKEWLELVRTKKILFYVIFPVAALLFVLFTVVAMDWAMQQLDAEVSGLMGTFKSLEGMMTYYVSMLLTYYVIITMILQSGSTAKEIKRRQWLLPANAGIRRRNIVLAKIVVLGLVTVIPAFLGLYLSIFVGWAAFGNPTNLGFGDVAATTLGALLTLIIVTVATTSLSAITERTGATAAIVICGYLVGDMILSPFMAVFYTPFAFEQIALSVGSAAEVTVAQWISAGLTTLLLLGGLIYWALYKRDPRLPQEGFRR